MSDSKYMQLAIKLAQKGASYVNPNPMVGAVIVKDNHIIGQGYHEFFGGPHAERNALKNCRESPVGATLYVTLEPCCHFGKTPPCIDAIIDSGITRVVIGSLDCNPIVSGKGVKILEENNLQVTVGVLENECLNLIKSFRKYITQHVPYVFMKYAMTMDGKIATKTNQSKWITGEEARKHVHQLRHHVSAIMVGVNTVIQDDPLLTCRLEEGKNPIRIICDTHLRTPLTSKIVKTANDIKTYIATSSEDKNKMKLYQNHGCEILSIKKKGNHIDLSDLMQHLGNMQIDSLLLEGGSLMNWSALEQQIVDEIGQEKMAAFLSRYGDKIDAVICNNDDMALGAIEALKAAGYFTNGKYIPVVGVDATTPAVQALKDGTLLGTVLNNAKKQANKDKLIYFHLSRHYLLN